MRLKIGLLDILTHLQMDMNTWAHESWTHGHMDTMTFGYIDTWTYEHMDTWTHTRIHGHMDTWLH